MRVSNKELERITELSNRTLGDGKTVFESDLKTAVLHVRWMASIDRERAESWGRFYGRLFKKIGVSFPAVGKDRRSVSSPVNALKAGRPSGRPSYCAHVMCSECARCPARWGRYWDCTGRPVSGSWGISEVIDGVEVRACRRKDGKPLRGSFFAGGYAFSSALGGWYNVPKGWRGADYVSQMWPVAVKVSKGVQ